MFERKRNYINFLSIRVEWILNLPTTVPITKVRLVNEHSTSNHKADDTFESMLYLQLTIISRHTFGSHQSQQLTMMPRTLLLDVLKMLMQVHVVTSGK